MAEQGVIGLDYYVLTDEMYNDLIDLFGSSDIVANFFQVDGITGYWFALQDDINGKDGVREYDDIVFLIGDMNLGTAFFTRSNEANINFPGL